MAKSYIPLHLRGQVFRYQFLHSFFGWASLVIIAAEEAAGVSRNPLVKGTPQQLVDGLFVVLPGDIPERHVNTVIRSVASPAFFS
jgi:hypothetical protein